MKLTTLCLLLKEGKILLAMKKRGFGVGKWNGVGGKVEAGESIKLAAARELKEEIGVDFLEEHLEETGNIKFYFDNKPEWNQHVHIFTVKNMDMLVPFWFIVEIEFDIAGLFQMFFEKIYADLFFQLPCRR